MPVKKFSPLGAVRGFGETRWGLANLRFFPLWFGRCFPLVNTFPSVQSFRKKAAPMDLKACRKELGAGNLDRVFHEGGWLEQEAWQSPP